MFGDATARYQRARNWAVGSDPGLLRLRMATRTTGALATALLVLFLLTKATGQPLTVALLGALIAMISARSVNEPDPVGNESRWLCCRCRPRWPSPRPRCSRRTW